MDAAHEPTQVRRVLDEADARVGRRGVPGAIGHVVDAEQETRDELDGDEDEGDATEIAIGRRGVVGNAVLELALDRLHNPEALIEPRDDCHGKKL